MARLLHISRAYYAYAGPKYSALIGAYYAIAGPKITGRDTNGINIKGVTDMKGFTNAKSTFNISITLLTIYLLSVGSAFAEPAMVIGIDKCTLLDGNGFVAFEAGSGVTVSAQSSNNNSMHTCSANVIPPDSGRSAIFNIENTGFPCGLDDGFGGNLAVTNDWHQVVSARGKAKLVCHFKS